MPIDSRSSPSPQSRATFSWFLLISANVLWATSYVADKLTLQTPSVLLMLLHMDISVLIFLPLLITVASIIGSIVFWIPVTALGIFCGGWHLPDRTTWLSIGWQALMTTVIAYLAWFQGSSKSGRLTCGINTLYTAITWYSTCDCPLARSACIYEICKRYTNHYKCVRHF